MTDDGKPGGITPSQTVGPFFAYALTPAGKYALADLVGTDLVTEDAAGTRIAIAGRVFDGDGAPVGDAMIEIWQADGEGRYAHAADGRARPNTRFKGFGRSDTNGEGHYRLFRALADALVNDTLYETLFGSPGPGGPAPRKGVTPSGP